MISGFCFALRGSMAYCDPFYMVCIILLDRVYYCYSDRRPENIMESQPGLELDEL